MTPGLWASDDSGRTVTASDFFQNNIQQVFQKLHGLLQEEYSGEDLQIIACPSMEQVIPCVFWPESPVSLIQKCLFSKKPAGTFDIRRVSN